MGVYVFLFALTTIATLIDKKDKKKILYSFIVLSFILIVGLRDIGVGTDTINYYNGYLYSMGERIEPLFLLIRKICRDLGFSVNTYFVVLAALNFMPLWYVIRRESKNCGFSLLIFYTFSNAFFFETFNTIRACLAISYFMAFCYFLQNEQLKKAILLAIIAVLFHYSTIILMLFVIPIYFIKDYSFKFVWIAVVCSFIIGMFGGNFAQGISNKISTSVLFLSDNTLIQNYYNYVDNFRGSSWNLIGKLTTLLPFSIFAILTYDNINKTTIYYRLFTVGVILNNLFISAAFTYRITAFLFIPLIILLPNAYANASFNKRKTIKGCTLFMLLWFVYKLATASELSFSEAFPYKSCLD